MQAVAKVKRLCKIKKAGHTGTLDPLATGVLPICTGRATRIAQYLLASDKIYRTQLLLGITTDTYDSEGKVLEEREVPELTEADLETVLQEYRGEIQQVPPAFSALKVKGKRAYELAREGKEVKLDPRTVTVHELKLEVFEPPFATLYCKVSKGTYIRSLIRDIGESLGCGAHMTQLRRLQAGQHLIEDAITFEELEANLDKFEGWMQSIPQALSHLPRVILTEPETERLLHGQVIPSLYEKSPSTGPLHLAVTPEEELIALLLPQEKGWKLQGVFN